MSGLVVELQRDALDRNVRVSDLLRKAFVVSKKLNIQDMQQWICCELNGYEVGVEIPDYREVSGTPKVINPYHGLQSINIQSASLADSLSRTRIGQSVGEIDKLSESAENNYLYIDYPIDIKNDLMSSMRVPLNPILVIPSIFAISILDSVRNKILDWSLELESQGVIGEGMSFSEKEKQAANPVNYSVTNNIGSMNNSQLQQDSSNANQTLTVTQSELADVESFIKELKEQISQIPLSQPEQDELHSEILTVDTQLSSPKPKSLIIKESLKSIRALLEGVTASMVASGLLAKLAALGVIVI